MHNPTDRITHTMAFVTPVMEHWLEWEIAQWVHHEGSTGCWKTSLCNGHQTDSCLCYIRKEGNVLFNDALNTFYLRSYGVRHMVKDHSVSIEETCYRHMGYSFRLAARVLLYASSHRQDNTYHNLCYTSRGALAEMGNSSMGSPWRIIWLLKNISL